MCNIILCTWQKTYVVFIRWYDDAEKVYPVHLQENNVDFFTESKSVSHSYQTESKLSSKQSIYIMNEGN